MSTLDKGQLEAQRSEWVTALENGKQELDKLSRQVAQLQQQLVALDGAIQACDVMLKKLETPSDESTN